jgi:hypothetical protein
MANPTSMVGVFLHQRKKTIGHAHHIDFLNKCQQNNMIPKGLRIKSSPHIHPIAEEFLSEWITILNEASRKLIQILKEKHLKLLKASQIKEEHI